MRFRDCGLWETNLNSLTLILTLDKMAMHAAVDDEEDENEND